MNGDFPYQFNAEACQKCGGECCRGSQGYVWISVDELEDMARARQVEVEAFVRQYVRQVEEKMALRERFVNGEYFCCFFDSIDCRCTIYAARPQQCRDFPFWEEFKKDPGKLLAECPGVIL